jgi:hypothetical protein
MSMKTIARNKHGDDVLKLFAPLIHRVTSRDWKVYVHQGHYERLVRGEKEGATLTTYSVLRPSIFDGFKQVVVASACMKETMFYRLFTAQGVSMEPVKGKLSRDLRYHQHEHGDRITIFYASPEAWSKRYRDKLVDDGQGGTVKLLTQIKKAVGHLFGDEPFLWMGNKDLGDTFFPQSGAEKLPNTPHGLNSFQGFHNVVVLSALNPPPQHFHFMEGYSIDGDEVRAAHYKSAVYQAVMRCSIRNPKDETPKQVVVMDRDTAEWLAVLFPGAKVESLPGLDGVPSKGKAGRPRKHANDAEKTKAFREVKKREHLAQLDLINGTSLVIGRYPDLGQQVQAEMREFVRNENSLLEREFVTPEAASSSTSGTAFASIYDALPLAHVDYEDDDSFIAFLRDLHGRVVAKENSGLFSPAHFDPTKAAETSRGLDNITHVRGIWFDNDGGDLTPDVFADLFPYLRVVIWNTSSSTAEKPRWRAFIPTTCAMSMDVHRLLMKQFETVLNRAGYWSKKHLAKKPGINSRRSHGFDESKFNPASLFYLPSQARDPKDSFFRDYAENDPKRGTLDVHQWVENCILNLKPEPEPVRVVAAPVLTPKPLVLFDDVDPEVVGANEVVEVRHEDGHRLERVREELLAKDVERRALHRDEKVARAVEDWRLTPAGMGHAAFFKLGAALRGAGLDEFEIRAKLHEEAIYANSPKERRNEIKGILKKLRYSGTFSRRGA